MKGDPYWLEARFPGKCSGCGDVFKKGARIFYYPRTQDAYCAKAECGGAASADFDARAFDDSSCCW